jgi:G3E family GTPase
MPNGCLCCSAKDDLINTLETLLQKRNDLEYILIETNGLSDPSSIIKTFWLDEGYLSKVKLHSAIVMIDAKNFTSKI